MRQNLRVRITTAILIAFGLLAAAYAFRIAPGNAPDERAHTEYMLTLERGAIPVWNRPSSQPYSYEAHQPPLYYIPGSLFLRLFQGWPAPAKLRVLRLLSALMHLGVLIVLWRMGLCLYDNDGAATFGPLCALASLPMFAFIGATVTNDAAANLAGAGLLWFATTGGPENDGRRPWLFGLLAGAALLSKFTVLPIAAVCGTTLWRSRRIDRSGLLKAAVVIIAICGWFYARNMRLYGDVMGFHQMSRYDADRYRWSELGDWLVIYFESFWGRFGQMTQPMPNIAYIAAGIISILAVGGWIRHGRELIVRPARPLFLAAYVAALGQNFYFGFFLAHQPQARYSFVALTAWAVLFWDGLSAWEHDIGQRTWIGARASLAARWTLAAAALLLQACAWHSL